MTSTNLAKNTTSINTATNRQMKFTEKYNINARAVYG